MAFTIIKRTDEKLVIKVGNKLYTSKDVKDCTRLVYIFDKFVVKFDSGWVEQNVRELELWNSIDRKDRQHFAKIIDWCDDGDGGIALRQVRVIEGDNCPTKIHEKTFRRITDLYGVTDVHVDAEDGYTFNCFITETNRLKIYDFGRD